MDANAFCTSIAIADKKGIAYLSRMRVRTAGRLSRRSVSAHCLVPATDFFTSHFCLSPPHHTATITLMKRIRSPSGLVSGTPRMHHIRYSRICCRLLHAICMEKHDLPIHASMLSDAGG